jgi:hypothetical protein
MIRLCSVAGCTRQQMASSSGNQYPMCESHTRHYLSQAFERKPEWVRRAEQNRLPVKDYR